jgi:hypothetical protein
MTTTEPRERLQSAIAKLGLSIKAEFVPWSKSRNAKEKYKSLNWRVKLLKGERVILETDYSAGEGHCPSYKQSLGRGKSYEHRQMLDFECENGKAARYRESIGVVGGSLPINPDPVDVIHSLVMDAGVIDYARYEDWASEFGYDPDSRKAETTYRACLQHALALREAVGDAGIQELREAGQDY